MNRAKVGKKECGDRKKRLNKRERIKRDSTVKLVPPLFLTALSSRMASRVVGSILSQENIKKTEENIAREYQTLLEEGVRGAIQIQSANSVQNDPKAEQNLNEQMIETESPPNKNGTVHINAIPTDPSYSCGNSLI